MRMRMPGKYAGSDISTPHAALQVSVEVAFVLLLQ